MKRLTVTYTNPQESESDKVWREHLKANRKEMLRVMAVPIDNERRFRFIAWFNQFWTTFKKKEGIK